VVSRPHEGWLRDLSYALRAVLRERSFSSTVVTTLAVGIGAVVAAFAVVTAVLLRPLPVKSQARLAVITANNLALADPHIGVSNGMLAEFRARSRSIDEVAGVPAALAAAPYAVRDRENVLQLAFSSVTGNFFQLLGAHAERGRLLDTTDERGAEGPVVVISYAAWKSEFASRQDIVGHQITLNIGNLNIVGVASKGFDYPHGTDVWMVEDEEMRMEGATETAEGGYWDLLVRLKPNAKVSTAVGEFERILRASSSPAFGDPTARRATGESYVDVVVGKQRPIILLFSFAVTLVLIVACINVAGLLLARRLSRTREITIRRALGADDADIVRHFAAESIILGLVGGIAGACLSGIAVRGMIALAPSAFARFDEIRVDPSILAFALVVTVVATVAFGILPTVVASRMRIESALRTENRALTGDTRTIRSRRRLVIFELALAVVVLSAAGLLMHSLKQLEHIDLGFDPANLLFVFVEQLDTSPNENDAALTVRHTTVMEGLAERLSNSPGVLAATPVGSIPFGVVTGTGGLDVHYGLEGQGFAEGMRSRVAGFETATDDYFRTLRIRLVAGREFGPGDNVSAPRVTIVSRSFADRAWPGRNALGQRVRFLNNGAVGSWRTVVGVVSNTRYHDLVSPRPEVYIPVRQTEPGTFLAIRTVGDPMRMLPDVRRTLISLDQGYDIAKAISGSDLLAASLAQARFMATVVLGLAAITLVLASIGLFGLLTFSFAQREREFGIRAALGATSRRLRAVVMLDALGLAARGAIAGLAFALPAGWLMRHQLYDVNAIDPLTIVLVIFLLFAVAVLASLSPVIRVSSVDPVEVLRAD